jgi:hypothetical protein
MDTNGIINNFAEMEIPMGSDNFEELESDMARLQRWDRYKNELEAALAHLPSDIRKARIELAFNRWHGIGSSKDLLARAKNKNAPQIGELFQGTYGAENLDE